MLLCQNTAFLVARTLISIWIAKLDGSIVRALVDRDGAAFLRRIGAWAATGVVASGINSSIKYLESELAISFRTSLTKHALKRYLSDDVYYRVSNLDGRCENPDQVIDADIWAFSKLAAHLYDHLSKPTLDIALISAQLIMNARTKGTAGSDGRGLIGPTALAAGAISIAVKILNWTSPPFSKLTKRQAELQGSYRSVLGRVGANSETIAFYGGNDVEHGIVWRAYGALVRHMHGMFKARRVHDALQSFLMKYLFSIAGFGMVAWPVFMSEAGANQSVSDRTQGYVTSRSLLTNAADAIDRIMGSYKEITELAGYTHRVTDMFQVFEDVDAGHYERPGLMDSDKLALLAKRGKQVVSPGGAIDLVDVPIVSPLGDVLVKALTMRIEPGTHLLICGPNGCGKSSLFRILGGLWPSYGGTLSRPQRSDCVYVPQTAYMPLGTLRDIAIYPHTHEQMRAQGRTDAELDELTKHVALSHIVEREGGWDAEKPWIEVLSGGEKQRIGMLRLFYHGPRWAILDECTSAVSMDIEGKMYKHAKDMGISLMTVTHRPSLWRWHNVRLQFDGEGGYTFAELNTAELTTLQEERERLEAQLERMPQMQQRLRELNAIVGGGASGESGSEDEAQDEAQAAY